MSLKVQELEKRNKAYKSKQNKEYLIEARNRLQLNRDVAFVQSNTNQHLQIIIDDKTEQKVLRRNTNNL